MKKEENLWLSKGRWNDSNGRRALTPLKNWTSWGGPARRRSGVSWEARHRGDHVMMEVHSRDYFVGKTPERLCAKRRPPTRARPST
jgi:hypothetical protein